MAAVAAMVLSSWTVVAATDSEEGFVSLFNGQDLTGWRLVDGKGPGYVVRDGMLVCPAEGGGHLFTERTYQDFVLRLEFKLTAGANNGVAIRSPMEGSPSYLGMEIQILDNSAKRYAGLRPTQLHGALFDVEAARGQALKPPGEWNEEEIECEGRHLTVRLNGQIVLDLSLNAVLDQVVLQRHPGLLRREGHLGFLSNTGEVVFRNLRVREIVRKTEDNTAPSNFAALFNGRDLSGWKGWIDPAAQRKMSAEERLKAQARANELMHRNWKVEDGTVVYEGAGFDNLCTERDFGDFELQADWKIEPKGDSGIYVRGTPQVQIWDRPEGSGGLFNNKTHPSQPLAVADRPAGEWNHFCILMTGEKVTVYLNDQLVVHDVVLENYWERHKPIPAIGPIELQAHRDRVSFKNIYLRELPRGAH